MSMMGSKTADREPRCRGRGSGKRYEQKIVKGRAVKDGIAKDCTTKLAHTIIRVQRTPVSATLKSQHSNYMTQPKFFCSMTFKHAGYFTV